MKSVNKTITFVFFLEEFLLWQPGRLRTLAERFALIFFNSFSYEELSLQQGDSILFLINPFFFILLFLASAGPLVDYFKSTLSDSMKAELLIRLERHSYIRVFLGALAAIIFLLQFLSMVNNPSVTFMSLVQNKSLWMLYFMFILVKKLLSDKNW